MTAELKAPIRKPQSLRLSDNLNHAMNRVLLSLQRQEQPVQGLLLEVYRCLEQIQRHLEPEQKQPARLQLVPQESGLEVELLGQSRIWLDEIALELRPRFIELLCVLAMHPGGLTGEELALAVWGEATDPNCVKTELCRLRQIVPLESRPYRLKVPVQADFLELLEYLRRGWIAQALQLYKGPLLPRSEAPEIVETRELIEGSLRKAVIQSQDPELLWTLAERLKDDLELWEITFCHLPDVDPRRPLARAQLERLMVSWKL